MTDKLIFAGLRPCSLGVLLVSSLILGGCGGGIIGAEQTLSSASSAPISSSPSSAASFSSVSSGSQSSQALSASSLWVSSSLVSSSSRPSLSSTAAVSSSEMASSSSAPGPLFTLLSSDGTFTTGKQNFVTHLVGATATFNGVFATSITTASANLWDVQLIHPISPVKDLTYTLCYDAKAQSARTMEVNLDGGSDNQYQGIIAAAVTVPLTTTLSPFKHSFKATVTDLSGRLTFNMGKSASNVTLDNIRLAEGTACATQVTPPVSTLKVNPARGEWTLVVIPDTQHYSQNRANAPLSYFHEAFKWLVDNRSELNIQYVQGLGDITETWNNTQEWTNATGAWYKLKQQIPHMPVQGNHDDPASMNKYFPVSVYQQESWWGGAFNGIENSYTLLDIGQEKYLFLQLQTYDQYLAPKRTTAQNQSALGWANATIAKFPDRKAILATHDLWATQTVRNEVLVKHDNLVLANAGHDCVREATYITNGPNGGTANNFIVDYQCDSQEVMQLRFYVFKPMDDRVDYYSYSPITQTFEEDASSQGSFKLLQLDP